MCCFDWSVTCRFYEVRLGHGIAWIGIPFDPYYRSHFWIKTFFAPKNFGPKFVLAGIIFSAAHFFPLKLESLTSALTLRIVRQCKV